MPKRKRSMGLHNRLELYTFKRLQRENPECVLPVGCTYDEALHLLWKHADAKAAAAKAEQDANVQEQWWNK